MILPNIKNGCYPKESNRLMTSTFKVIKTRCIGSLKMVSVLVIKQNFKIISVISQPI